MGQFQDSWQHPSAAESFFVSFVTNRVGGGKMRLLHDGEFVPHRKEQTSGIKGVGCKMTVDIFQGQNVLRLATEGFEVALLLKKSDCDWLSYQMSRTALFTSEGDFIGTPKQIAEMTKDIHFGPSISSSR